MAQAKDEYGSTALIFASLHGHREGVELLLAKGAQVNARDWNGSTPLMGASEKGHQEVRKLLIEAGAR
jgi:uncharacterized protein